MEFSLIQTPSGFDALATDWNALLVESIANVPFLRHEYLRTWWSTLGGGEWPRGELAIVTASEYGRLVGLAPLFLTEDRYGQPALMLLGSLEISDYLDLIARPDDLPSFVGGLLDYLILSEPSTWRAASTPFACTCAGASVPPWPGRQDRRATAARRPSRPVGTGLAARTGCETAGSAWYLDWYNLPETSPTLPLLQAEAGKRGWIFNQENYRPAISVPLPGDFDIYLNSIDKKQRHEIRRKMRRIHEFGLSVRWYIVEHEATLEAEIDNFLALMANDPAKAIFLTETMRAQMRASIKAAFRAGWLQLAFLTLNGEKAASYLNFDYNNRIWIYNSGIDYKYLELSPGWVLLGYLLEWANEHQRAEFDFMRGNEDYKYRFGGVGRWVVRAKIVRVNASA